MKPKIEKPKIFISYAWGSKDYQEKVLSLASDLQSDGIEVLLDKWNLKEGNDKYAYMEQCVNDDAVTNVLILLDPIYAQKADERVGGVGTETQIISAEIYNKVSQEKFIPVIMERADDLTVPKPHYLKSILHFDLSNEDNYDDEYQRLVKRLYGIEIYVKPALGNTPKWVTEEQTIPTGRKTKINSLKKKDNPKLVKSGLVEILNELKDRIVKFNSDYENYLDLYSKMFTFRDEFLEIVQSTIAIDGTVPIIGDFFQELYYEFENSGIQIPDIKKTFLQEIFIYTIAICYRAKDYESLAYFINRSYLRKRYGKESTGYGFGIFYYYSQLIDSAKKKKDDKNYYSGTAQYWIENIAINYCNKKEFVFADVLLCNYAVYGANYGYEWEWFPITYVYGGAETIDNLSYRLISKEFADIWSNVFGYDNIQGFIDRIKEHEEEMRTNGNRRPRYSASFDDAPLFSDFINPNEIATIR